MEKFNAISLLLRISDECGKSKKCMECSFYNVDSNIEGCAFDVLNKMLPSNIRERLNIQSIKKED